MSEVRTKRVRDAVDGVLLLDKPVGLSSNDALIKAKRFMNAKKAGHTGTLDPFATGLLPLCFGEATKFSQDLLEADKTYLATVHLGLCTDTGDTEGAVTATREVSCTLADIEAVLPRFRGPIKQVPPMYSALKRDGKPLYEYAREGITLEREARDVLRRCLHLQQRDLHPRAGRRHRRSPGRAVAAPRDAGTTARRHRNVPARNRHPRGRVQAPAGCTCRKANYSRLS